MKHFTGDRLIPLVQNWDLYAATAPAWVYTSAHQAAAPCILQANGQQADPNAAAALAAALSSAVAGERASERSWHDALIDKHMHAARPLRGWPHEHC